MRTMNSDCLRRQTYHKFSCLYVTVVVLINVVSISTQLSVPTTTEVLDRATLGIETTKCKCGENEDSMSVVTLNYSANLCRHLANENLQCCSSVKVQNIDGPFQLNCSTDTCMLAGLKKIKSLDISDSGVKSVDLLGKGECFENLQHLDLSGNPTLEIDSLFGSQPHALTKLTRLKLSSSEIGSDKLMKLLRKLPNIEFLDASFCNITSVNFTEISVVNKKLSNVQLAGNRLETVTFIGDIFKQLDTLNLSNCSIRELLFEGERRITDPQLKVVDLSFNQLKSVPEFFVRALENFRVLNITGNRIEPSSCDVYHLWKLLFQSDSRRTTVISDIDWKKVSRPSVDKCSWENCPFECQCLEKVKTVNCSYRGLVKPPDIGPSEAEVLLLQGNSISDSIHALFDVGSWCSLKDLNMQGNGLSGIMNYTQKLNRRCPCLHRRKSNCILPRLKHVNLGNNTISSLSKAEWKLLQGVFKVDLNNNKIGGHRFIQDNFSPTFSKTRELDLSFNSLDNLETREIRLFPFLRWLNLSHNSFKEFSFSLITLTPSLETLDLSNNRIQKIDNVEVISKSSKPYGNSIPHLRVLYLHHNNLVDINPAQWTTLQDVTLRGNQWNCSEELIDKLMYFFWKNMGPRVAKELEFFKCEDGSLIQDLKLSEFARKNYKLSNEQVIFAPKELQFKRKFFILVGCTILFIFISIFILIPLKNYLIWWLRKQRPSYIQTSKQFRAREYDLFLFYCHADMDEVVTNVYPLIVESGNWHIVDRRSFILGRDELDLIVTNLSSSKRMLVVISENFYQSAMSLRALKEGIIENIRQDEFKIACIKLGDAGRPVGISFNSSVERFLTCETRMFSPRDRGFSINIGEFLAYTRGNSQAPHAANPHSRDAPTGIAGPSAPSSSYDAPYDKAGPSVPCDRAGPSVPCDRAGPSAPYDKAAPSVPCDRAGPSAPCDRAGPSAPHDEDGPSALPPSYDDVTVAVTKL